MNHSKENLDECVFDYLACNANQFIHIREIFNDIRGERGHRCEELTESIRDRRYFTTICYGLNSRYKNIKKRVIRGDLYLAFEKDYAPSDDDIESGKYEIWSDCLVRDVVEYMCDNDMYRKYEDSYFTDPYDGTDPLIHTLIKFGKSKTLERLVKERKLDLNCENSMGKTLLDVAIERGDKEIVLLLAELELELESKSKFGEKMKKKSVKFEEAALLADEEKTQNELRRRKKREAITAQVLKEEKEKQGILSQFNTYPMYAVILLYTWFVMWIYSLFV